MPELPEVEVICRGLRPHLQGRTIKSIGYSGKALRTFVPIELMRTRLCGATITDIDRRAKYLLISTDRGDLLVLHLGMTGKLGLFAPTHPPASHDHLFWLLDNSLELRFNDTRRFGSIHLFMAEDRSASEDLFFKTTGPEPFSNSCNAEYLHLSAQGRTQAVKTFIMNNSIMAGVGNIYANESLFSAGIHPSTPAGRLTHEDWQRLIDQVRLILNWAIECGGSTIRDFLNAGGRPGYFQVNFRVYDRNGLPCRNCSTTLEKTVIGGRASYFCQQCQPLKK